MALYLSHLQLFLTSLSQNLQRGIFLAAEWAGVLRHSLQKLSDPGGRVAAPPPRSHTRTPTPPRLDAPDRADVASRRESRLICAVFLAILGRDSHAWSLWSVYCASVSLAIAFPLFLYAVQIQRLYYKMVTRARVIGASTRSLDRIRHDVGGVMKSSEGVCPAGA